MKWSDIKPEEKLVIWWKACTRIFFLFYIYSSHFVGKGKAAHDVTGSGSDLESIYKSPLLLEAHISSCTKPKISLVDRRFGLPSLLKLRINAFFFFLARGYFSLWNYELANNWLAVHSKILTPKTLADYRCCQFLGCIFNRCGRGCGCLPKQIFSGFIIL